MDILYAYFLYFFLPLIGIGYIFPKVIIFVLSKIFTLTPNFFAIFFIVYMGGFYFYIQYFRGPPVEDLFGIFLSLPFLLSGFYIGYRWAEAKDNIKNKKG